MAKQYRIKASGAGPWLQGQIVDAETFEAHPFKDKFLRNNSAEVVADDEAQAATDTATQKRLAELNTRIGELTAERDTLLGRTPEPHAPAQVAVQLDRTDPPNAQEAEATRAAGNEVIQPTPGDGVNLGEAVRGEAAQDAESRDIAPKRGPGRPPKDS